MVRIELTDQEAVILSQILESYVSDLRAEIVATEKKEWRAEMKDREGFCRNLINRLAAR